MAPISKLATGIMISAVLSGALALPTPDYSQLSLVKRQDTSGGGPDDVLPTDGDAAVHPQGLSMGFPSTGDWLRRAGYPAALVDWLEQIWGTRNAVPANQPTISPSTGVGSGQGSASGDEGEDSGPDSEEDSGPTSQPASGPGRLSTSSFAPGPMSGSGSSFRSSGVSGTQGLTSGQDLGSNARSGSRQMSGMSSMQGTSSGGRQQAAGQGNETPGTSG